MADPTEQRQYDTYQETTNRLADRVGADLAALWVLREAGRIDPAVFDQLAASLVMAGKQLAARNADLALSAALTARRGTDVLPTGVGVPAAEESRLRAAVAVILDDTDEPTARLVRIGKAETWKSGTETWQRGLKRNGVERWTRQAAGKSCPACLSLANGAVLSIDTTMWTHPGCDCVQAIV